MSKRTIEAYEAALKYVHENLISLNSNGFIIDFEAAMRSALLKVVPDTNVLGCWFHFCQCLRRKMASLTTLHDVVRNDPNGSIKDIFRRFQCLALLPADQIEAVFLKLCEDALKLCEHFAAFIDYFDKEWIHRVKPQHFSVFLRGTRTTSAAESFNAKVNKAFKTHGNFYHFCEKLQVEELVSTEDLEKYVNGTIPRTYQRPFLKKRSELIQKYSLRLKNGQIDPYLFLKTMANIKNKIIYSDTDISLHSIEVEMSIGTQLMEGFEAGKNASDDDQFEEVLYAQIENDESPLNVSTIQSDENQRVTRSKRKASEMQSNISKRRAIDIDESDDANNIDIFVSITEKGAILSEIEKKIHEIKINGINSTSTKCVLCCKAKQSMVLLPCRHQITCEQCWVIWADGNSKPNCPKCKNRVKQTINILE